MGRKCRVILDFQEILLVILQLLTGKIRKVVWVGRIDILPKVMSVYHGLYFRMEAKFPYSNDPNPCGFYITHIFLEFSFCDVDGVIE